MILTHKQILKLQENDPPLIEKFQLENDSQISNGLDSHGYNLRLADELYELRLQPDGYNTLDPHNLDPDYFVKINPVGNYFVLPPHSFHLAKSIETLNIPNNIVGQVWGKSTYARSGLLYKYELMQPLIQPPTILEAGWRGEVTLELFNPTNFRIIIYIGEGISQVQFVQSDMPEQSYQGKYQNQKGVTFAK